VNCCGLKHILYEKCGGNFHIENLLNGLAFGPTMKYTTHNRIGEKLDPYIDPEVIERINRAIDTPKPWMPPYSPMLGPAPRWRKGHRKYGHDLPTSTFIGYMHGGLRGIPVAWVHIAGDAVRDEIVNKMGEDAANMFESGFTLVMTMLEKRRGGKSDKKKRPKKTTARRSSL
jgi:hypothetical protein